jgi:hypothetical protein
MVAIVASGTADADAKVRYANRYVRPAVIIVRVPIVIPAHGPIVDRSIIVIAVVATRLVVIALVHLLEMARSYSVSGSPPTP